MKKVILLLIIMSLVFTAGCVDEILESFTGAVDPDDHDEIMVEIPSGSGASSIADILFEEGLISNTFVFKQKAKLDGKDSKFQAGKYIFTKSMDMIEIMDKIASGDVFIDSVKVTIPEGYEVHEIIDVLVEAGLVSEEEFRKELKDGQFDYPFLEGIDRETYLEGFLFPDTYEIDKSLNAYEIADLFLKRFDAVFKEEYYARIIELGMDMNELITLASIVEREARVDEERAIVSSVFHNRLEIGMSLQSCATVQYILGERKARLTYDDIAIESDYNTYLNSGLPPAPIASPGEKSLVAALYPEDTEYLYFVTKETNDGSHYFSRTLEEHNYYKSLSK